MRLKSVLILYAVFVFSMVACSEPQQKSQQSEKNSQESVQTEESLFEMAAKAEASNRFGEAVKYYDTIIKEYPKSARRDKALFMSGYIKYEILKENEQALTNFETVLSEYPNSDLVDDAQFMIKAINAGKDALTVFEESNSGK